MARPEKWWAGSDLVRRYFGSGIFTTFLVIKSHADLSMQLQHCHAGIQPDELWNASGVKAAEQFAIASLIQATACG